VVIKDAKNQEKHVIVDHEDIVLLVVEDSGLLLGDLLPDGQLLLLLSCRRRGWVVDAC